MTKKQEKSGKIASTAAEELRRLRRRIKTVLNEKTLALQECEVEGMAKGTALTEKMREIVGGSNLEERDVPSEYFADEELKEKQRLMRARPALKDFWLRVWSNTHYAGTLTESDYAVLEKLEGLALRACSSRELSLTFTFSPGHPHIKPGAYTRSLLYRSGQCVELGGDRIPGTGKIKKGIFKLLSMNLIDSDEYGDIIRIIEEFMKITAQEVLPYALEYYLQEKPKPEAAKTTYL